MRSRFLVLVSVLLLVSCFNDKNFDFKKVSLSPTMAIPLAFCNMGLVNMLSSNDSAYVQSDSDGLLYFYYPHTLGSTDIREQFSLPNNTSTTAFDLVPGSLPASGVNQPFGTINREINLNLSPEKLTEALLKAGTLTYTVALSQQTSPPNLPLQANISMPGVVHKTTGAPLTITATNGTQTVSVTDYKLIMSDNKFDVRVDLIIKPHPTTFIPVGTKANIVFAFEGMEFAYIKGFLGDQVVPIPPQIVDISVFESALKDATISFVQPTLTMNVVNDYGASVEVNFTTLQGTKEGANIPLQISPANPVNLNSPTVLGNSASTEIDIANEHAVVNFGPTKLEYEAAARINKGLSTANNFLADTSKLRIQLTTRIPIYGKVSGIKVMDTLDIDLESLQGSSVQTASMKISGRNEMPLDVNLQIYLADKDYQILDSVFAPNETYIVKASTVDGNGDLVSQGVSEVQFGLETASVSKLFASKYLILKAIMNTARDNGGAQLNVKFKANQKLRLNIGLLAKFNLNTE